MKNGIENMHYDVRILRVNGYFERVMISTEKAHFPSGVLYGLCMCTQSWYDNLVTPRMTSI